MIHISNLLKTLQEMSFGHRYVELDGNSVGREAWDEGIKRADQRFKKERVLNSLLFYLSFFWGLAQYFFQ